ncbi:unnamed protein product [Heligmosomoides polygyrus]|uniref:Uncharacterized protein n=1 Tax=Heligmosomoides polygyrus TaxID=6339 RepID=A0A183FY85_HELPZ|nr:unnamed protein product [Heligmosomoides polygyrus]
MLLIPLSIAMIPIILCALIMCTCCCGPKESRGSSTTVQFPDSVSRDFGSAQQQQPAAITHLFSRATISYSHGLCPRPRRLLTLRLDTISSALVRKERELRTPKLMAEPRPPPPPPPSYPPAGLRTLWPQKRLRVCGGNHQRLVDLASR